jgi:DNA-binding MarR family transcriptional regulator
VEPPRNPNVLLRQFINGSLANELLSRELGPAGVSPNQFGVESVIGALGPVTPTELAARLGMAPTTLSAWIRRLTESGHVQRRPNPDDGRSSLLELTESGRAAMQAAGPRFHAALVALEEALGDDAATVAEAGATLEAALRRLLATPAISQ